MADQTAADQPASDNPFDQIDTNPETANAEAQANANPFDAIGPDFKPNTSATGSFARGVEKGITPAAAGIAGAASGAETGAFVGSFGGPFAWLTVPAGTIAGGLIGGFGGAWAAGKAQDYALKKLPDSWQEAIGTDERQQRIDEGEHPVASFLGGLAPYAVTMNPMAAARGALPANATALQRIMAHPATARVFGGAAMGGMELGQELIHGDHPDWTKVAISTGFGIVLNRPNRIGETIGEAGAGPTRAALGVPSPATPEAATVSRETIPPAQPMAPAPAEPLADQNRGQLATASPPGAPGIAPTLFHTGPTLAQAADLKVMGPGVTEAVFQGSHQQNEQAALAAQDTARTEQSLVGPPAPPPDVNAVARRMEPDTFQQYDALVARRQEFQNWIAEHNNPADETVATAQQKADDLQRQLDAHVAARGGYTGGPDARALRARQRAAQREVDALHARREAFAAGQAEQTPELIAARQHLLATEYELRDLSPQIQAAYRRAADAAATQTVEPEPRAVEPAAPVSPVEEGTGLPAGARQLGLPGLAGEPVQPELAAANRPVPTKVAGTEPERIITPSESQGTKQEPGGIARSIEQQRDFIRNDVARQAVRAGRPTEEAQALGALEAARYEARAARFKGALGTPEELYRNEAAELLGQGMRSRQPPGIPQPRAPRQVDESKLSLFQFLAHRGGIKETPDLKAVLGDNPFVPGFGKLMRDSGMSMDKAREAAVEAGYLTDTAQAHGGVTESTINHLLESIDEEARGNRQYRAGHQPPGIPAGEEPPAGAHEAEEALEPHEITQRMLEGTLSAEDEREFAKELLQGANARIRFAEGRRPIMTVMRDANASSLIHEKGHEWFEQLVRDAQHPAAPESLKADAQAALDWTGAKSADDILVKHATKPHEKFARGFEQYLREGVAPSPALASVFAKFKNWLTTIYQTLKGLGKPINEDIRDVFDRLLAEEPQRTVIAPEQELAPTLASMHEADVAEMAPHEADAVTDRIAAERERAYADQRGDIRSEFETRIAQAEAEATGREPGEGLEPPGEEGQYGGGIGQVDHVGVEPGTEPGGGSRGAELPAERGGRTQGAPNGPGLRGAEPGPGRGKEQSTVPLAPSPAAEFGAAESPFVDRAGNIRVENLTSREDVAQAIHDAAEANEDFVGDRRGVITDGQVMDLASALGMDADRLNKRKIGEAFNAESIIAARKLLIESATNVSALMKKAATGTDEDVMAYAEAKDRHQMIQGQVAGITAEAGRALRAFRDIKGVEGQAEAKSVNDFIKSATGKTLFQLRMEAKLGAQYDTPTKVSQFLADAQKRTFGRMVLEYWINGLISGPATHITYMIGNTILAAERAGPETAAAAMIGAARKAMGREGERVRLGEVGAQFRGAIGALPAGLEAGAEAMRTGQTTLLPGEQARPLQPFQGDTSLAIARSTTNAPVTWTDLGSSMFSMIRGLRDGMVATKDLVMAGGDPDAPVVGFSYSPLGSIPDIAYRGVPMLPVGSAVRLPGRFIAAIHSFFRTVNYAMQKSALAYRQAAEEGLTGNAFDARLGDIWQNPSEQVMDQARQEATELTLMGHGSEFVQALGKLTNTKILGFPFLKFIDPFVHIAGNIMDQSIVRRTPLGILAPEIRADLSGKNGNVAQDTAMARMLVGTAISVTFGGLASQGLISGSGPKDPKEGAMWRLAGNQAHSVRIGDTWYQANRLGPMGMLMGVAADMYDVAHDAAHDDMLKAGMHLLHGVTQNILDESFMRGPAELIEALEDPGRYGERYIQNFLSSFVPYSVGMAQMARASDPYSRQARTVMDSIKAKVPGLSETLFPRRDIWGEPIPNMRGIGPPGLTAIWAQHVSSDPVNQAMMNLGIFPAAPERKIRNVELTDQEYDDFTRIAGRMTKMRLDAIARSADFQTWPNHIKRAQIEETIKQCREAARGAIMGKYPHIPIEATQALIKKKTAD